MKKFQSELEMPAISSSKLRISSKLQESIEFSQTSSPNFIYKVMVIGKKPPPRTIHRSFIYNKR